jgi:predicted SnoaL-like aldol condensation-catalyzing enzyme
MTKMALLALAAQVLLLVGGTPLAAQSRTAQEEKNVKLVLDFWREVLVARHTELAPKYMAEGYIQHNPNVPTGRAGFVTFFSKFPQQPIPATRPNPPIQVLTKGDLVVLVWDHEAKDPADPSKTYKYNSFDMFRVSDGKIQEHWDSAMKNPPGA